MSQFTSLKPVYLISVLFVIIAAIYMNADNKYFSNMLSRHSAEQSTAKEDAQLDRNDTHRVNTGSNVTTLPVDAAPARAIDTSNLIALPAEFSVVIRDSAPLRTAPKDQGEPVSAASIGDVLEIHGTAHDSRWLYVSKGHENFWINCEDVYREPKKTNASITLGFRDVRKGRPVTKDPQYPFAVRADVEILDYAVATDELDKESKNQFEQKSVVSSYTVDSDTAIKSVNEKLILSKAVVQDKGCYSTNKYIGTDISILSERTLEVNANRLSQSFSLPRKDLFSTKLPGDVLNAKLLYILSVKYVDESEESIVRAINLTWPLCM